MIPDHFTNYKHQNEFIAATLRRYHQHRRVFYTNYGKTINFAIIVLATSTIYAGGILGYLPVLAGILALMNIVYKPSHYAGEHEYLFKRWGDFISDMQVNDGNGGTGKDITKKRISIENDEPPYYNIVLRFCYNEVCRAKGIESQHLIKIGRFSMWTRNFWRYAGASFKTLGQVESEARAEAGSEAEK